MSKKLRNLEEDQEEESEGWLTSYSDMITDLLAVFVLLFSFAMLSQGIPKAASSELSVDMGGMPAILDGGARLEQSEAGSKASESEIDQLIEALNEEISQADMEPQISIEKQTEDMFIMRMSDSVLFNTGKADITPEANEILITIFDIMEGFQDYIEMIRIEGHTDNKPINTAQFPSNWELSSARALRVLKVLINTTTISPEQVSYTGYGEYHPLVENSSKENMAKNRRVDFVIQMEQEMLQ